MSSIPMKVVILCAAALLTYLELRLVSDQQASYAGATRALLRLSF